MASELPDSVKRGLQHVWTWLISVSTAGGTEARIEFLCVVEADKRLDDHAEKHMCDIRYNVSADL